jgi:hypothetical protein
MNHLLRRDRPHRPAAPTGVDQRVTARPLEFPAVHFSTFIFVSFVNFRIFLRADAIVMHFDLDGSDAIAGLDESDCSRDAETIAGHATPSITEP